MLVFSNTALAYCSKLTEFTYINIGAAFEHAGKFSSMKSPSELTEVLINNAREQFETLSEQVEELAAISQRTWAEPSENADSAFWD
jgi:hypothetical protein